MLFIVFMQSIFADTPSLPLSLFVAERLAIMNSPELQRLHANAEALEQQAVADGQLPDPQLMAGAINVPTDSFSFTQDEMTMIEAGLQQSFPPGHSRRYKSAQTKAMAEAERRQMHDQALVLLQDVRTTWLGLYYWTHAKQVIRANRQLLAYLVKATLSQYKVGNANQADVLQAQVELTRLDDQAVQIDQQIALLKAQLGRRIGQEQANRPLTAALPHWPAPPPLSQLAETLQQHPLLSVDAAKIQASEAQVAYAKEQYKPGFMIDAGYGFRQGTMNGSPRSDMVGAQLTIDLPIFTHQRQDKRLQSSTSQLVASQLDQQIHYRDLAEVLHSQYATWELLAQRETLFRQRLIPEAEQNAKATLRAYQSATIDVTPVLKAYGTKLDTELQLLQIQVERTKARAMLLYLQGK
ncbi:MAG: TolC family protein [Coxiellaceae bacterium]|nr:MAG: TolC family protein [Coxiellaceae bacterium]